MVEGMGSDIEATRCHKRITEGKFYCLGVGLEVMEERYNQVIQSGQVPSIHSQQLLHNSTCNSDFSSASASSSSSKLQY